MDNARSPYLSPENLNVGQEATELDVKILEKPAQVIAEYKVCSRVKRLVTMVITTSLQRPLSR